MVEQERKNSFKLRIRPEQNGLMDFKMLIFHPMEDGARVDKKTRRTIAADYIEWMNITVDGVEQMIMEMGSSISRTPFINLTFSTSLLQKKTLGLRWRDNHGQEFHHAIPLQFSADGVFRYSYA